jgi:type I restriction enzyme S subunit
METLQPKLRFPEFKDNWNKNKLDNFTKSISSGKSKTRESEGEYFLYGSTGIIGYTDANDYEGKCILVARVGANAGNLYKVDGNYSVTDNTLMLYINEDNFFDFTYYLLINAGLNKLVFGSGQPLITGGQLKNLDLFVPKINEQTKIASFLSAVDEKLNLLQEKKELLEAYKKGIMQKIFNQEIRFKDDNGNDFEDWDNITLGECLSFEQPTKYLVDSTDYNDDFETPVLTAGKTFILGYTDEVNGIFKKEELPVIIFDDFTTATQFVDFPFKAKSSAMKILKAKENINIKFVYEAMQNLMFEVGGHGRHWISIYSNLYIDLPTLPEQTKIANFLTAVDEKIKLVSNQIQDNQEYKKGLLQQMFV